MSDEPKGTQKEQGNTFDFSCCPGWSKMKLEQAREYDCTGMMSRMMEMCGDPNSEIASPEEPESSDTIV